MNRFLLLISLFALSAYAEVQDEKKPSEEKIHLSPRHIIILQADLENIWGTYYLAVMNRTESPLPFSTPITLPQETMEVKPQDGLKPEDLERDSSGILHMKTKLFPKGMTLIGVGFQCKIPNGASSLQLHFSPLLPIGELSIAVPNSTPLTLTGTGMEPGLPDMLTGSPYTGIMRRHPLATAETVTVTLAGIPNGRTALWRSGFGFAGVLFLGSAYWVLRSRRKR
jgi:hypothetical protein